MADLSTTMTGPRGSKPKKALNARNIMLYGILIVVCVYYLLPLWVMVMTSLKGMPEVRLGNIFSPPVEVTFQPWVKAWSEACTGLNCDGLSRGFWNSVLITVPSVIVSIAIASVNGYALINWKFKGSAIFFTILIFGRIVSVLEGGYDLQGLGASVGIHVQALMRGNADTVDQDLDENEDEF